jgi:hypothetical protein
MFGAKTTDAEGRFRFADVQDYRLSDAPGGKYTLQVVVPDWRGVYDVPAAVGDDVVITLPEGPAKLRIEMENLASDDVAIQYALATRTGGRDARIVRPRDRAFETEPFTPGKGLLVFRARGFGETEVEFEALAGRTTEIAVRLEPSGVVEGTAPVRDGPRHVRLTALVAKPAAENDLRPGLAGSFPDTMLGAGIAADGSFRFASVPPGSYRAVLFEANREAGAKDIVVRSGAVTTVSFD